MSFLEVAHVSKLANSETVIDAISFTQLPLEKVVIAGETGSGKSTLLKIIAGLEQADSGIVTFEGKIVKGPAETLVPGHKDIAYLSQHFELQQFLRVEQVLEYANKISSSAAKELFEVCAIDHLAKRRTDELSGGERQRIALAKLLIGAPKLLLLDEPFTNLDMVQKNILKGVLIHLSEILKMSIILVSHDPLDILPWADKILIMKDGKLIQTGSAMEIYERPVNVYAAGLFGRYNIIPGSVVKSMLPDTDVRGHLAISRPEFVRITRSKNDLIEAKVVSVNFFGNYLEIETRLARQSIFVRLPGNAKLPRKGDVVGLRFDKKKIHLTQH